MTLTSAAPKGGDCNTPLKLELQNELRLESHLDYLSGWVVIRRDGLPGFCRFLSDDKPFQISDKTRAYVAGQSLPSKVFMPPGVAMGFEPVFDGDNETDCIKTWVQLSGEYWESFNNVGAWRITTYLKRVGFECTRIDCALDDYSLEAVPVGEMVRAYDAGNGYYFRNYKLIESRKGFNNEREITHYFGSRQKLVRVYVHKFSENVDCMRYEAEFHGKTSKLIFEQLSSFERGYTIYHDVESNSIESINSGVSSFDIPDDLLDAEISRLLSAFALGAIDFRDRKGKEKVAVRDSKRLDWWQSFISLFAGFAYRPRFTTEGRTVKKSIDWLYRQVAPTLAAIRRGVHHSDWIAFLNTITVKGSERMGAFHRLLSAELEFHGKPSLLLC
jgi:hypothetical protein